MASVQEELQSLHRVLLRLQSAKSADVAALLETLLPKLMPLTNNESLRTKALSIVSEAMKRIKLEKCSLDLSNLICCIDPTMLPYGANFAMTFTDLAMDYNPKLPTGNVSAAVDKLLHLLGSFTPFSPHSNALCYYALVLYGDLFVERWAQHTTGTGGGDSGVTSHVNAREVLGDFALDIALLPRPVAVSGEAQSGSVHPGLSQTRIERFASRRKQWSAEQLRAFKLKLIAAIPSGLFLPKHAVLLSVILANDADAEVAAQATFKTNGVALMIGLDKDPAATSSVCEFLLATCGADSPAASPGAAPQPHKRSAMKPSVRLAALKWMIKHCASHLPSHAKAVTMNLFNMTFNPSAPPVASLLVEEVAVVAASCQLVETALQPATNLQYGEVVLLVTLCVKKVLQSFAYSTSSFSSSEAHTGLRSSCYHIVELTARRYLSVGEAGLKEWANAAAVAIAESADDSAGPATAAAAPVSSAPFLTQLSKATVQETDLLMLLFQLLYREHELRTESSILSIYRALNALREAHLFVRTTSQTAPGLFESTSGAGAVTPSSEAMDKLRDLLRRVRQNGSDTKMRLAALHWSRALFQWESFVLETMVALADDTSSAVVAFAVTEFQRLNRYLEHALAADQTGETGKVGGDRSGALQVVGDLIGLLTASPAPAAGVKGQFLLLRAVADTLRVLATVASADIPASVQGWDLAGLLRVCATLEVHHVELVIPGLALHWGEGGYFTSLTAVGDGDTADAVAVAAAGGEGNSTGDGHATSRGKRRDVTAASDLCAPFVRYAVSATRSVLQLRQSAAPPGPASYARQFTPQYLSWLAVPEVDVRDGLAAVLAMVCGEGRSEEDRNFVATLAKQLQHKLTPIDGDHPPATGGERLAARSAVGALRCTAELVASQDWTEEGEQQRLLLTVISCCHRACSVPLPATATLEDCLLQVVALEAIQRVAPRLSDADISSMVALLRPLLLHTDVRIAVPAITCYASLCSTPELSAELWRDFMTPALRSSESQSVKFAWAEGLLKTIPVPLTTADVVRLRGTTYGALLCDCMHSAVPGPFPTTDEVTSTVGNLLNIIVESSLSTTQSAVEKSTMCVAVLVIIKTLRPGAAFPKPLVRLVVEALLRFLKEKDVFIQDICCLALCHLYYTADRTTPKVPEGTLAGLAGQPVSVAEFVAIEVMVALSREKRVAQPVGYSAGGSTGSSRPAASPSGAGANTTGVAGAGGNTGETGAVAGGGGGAAPREDNHLLQAAVAAAAELGVGIRLDAAGAEEVRADPTDSLPSDYVVYVTICKMAKMAKDQSILFAVLALIHRDPLFGTGASRTYYQQYAAPQVTFSTAKLVQMLPMLYHARFDPNNTVRPVMRALWDVLMERHFPQQQHVQLDMVQRRVVTFLCQKLGSALWRDREAACLALEAFLPRRSWVVSIFPQLEDLFQAGLRVLDDTRDSTRTAAVSYMKVLSGHIVRACNPDESSAETVDGAVGKILPLLLEKGLVAPSAEARGVSLGLLAKVVEAARTAAPLRPWLGQVVSVLIEGMSALEPQTLQYMQFHTARLRISDEELEGMRIKMAQSSPLHDALEVCLTSLQQVALHDPSSTVVPEVMWGLSAQLQGGVGLPTRVAAANALAQMVERFPHYISPGSTGAMSAAVAFRAIVRILTASSAMAATLKKAMTSAFGLLSKVVDEDVLTAECTALVSAYLSLERDQLDRSVSLAQCIQQIVERGGDRLDEGASSRVAMWNNLLSCAFVGRHDTDPECKGVWEVTWESALSVSGAGTKLSALLRMLPNVLALVRGMCQELSWHRRAQAIRVLRDVVVTMPQDSLVRALSALPREMAELMRIVLALIPGPIWTGQAAVLEAVSELMYKYPPGVQIAPCASQSAASIVVLKVALSAQKAAVQDISEDATVADLTGSGLADSVLASLNLLEQGNTTELVGQDEPARPWAMDYLGWVVVLVHEARRGARNNSNVVEVEYRLAAAHAVGLLPWQKLCATQAGVQVFLQLLPLLCKQSSIPPYGAIQASVADSPPPGSAEGSAKQDNSSRKNKRALGNDALFGVRYGATQSAGPVAKTRAAPSEASSRQAASSGSATPEPAEQRCTAATPAIAGEGEDGAMQVDAEPTSSKEYSDKAPEESAPTTAANVEFVHKHPPVYSLAFLDSLTRAWPKGETAGAVQEVLVQYAGYVLAWTEAVMRVEVWSVRRAALQLLGVVCSAGHVPASEVSRVLTVVEAGIQEQKYAKVRVEALRTLVLVLQSPLRSGVDADTELKGRVREVIRTASTDSQPTILEAVAKVHDVWLS